MSVAVAIVTAKENLGMKYFFTVSQVAEELGVNNSTITRDAIACGVGVFIGNQKLFLRADIGKLRRFRAKKRRGGRIAKKVAV